MIKNLNFSVALTNTGERIQSNKMGDGPQWHGINTKFHETGALVSIILLFVFTRRQVEIRSYLKAS